MKQDRMEDVGGKKTRLSTRSVDKVVDISPGLLENGPSQSLPNNLRNESAVKAHKKQRLT